MPQHITLVEYFWMAAIGSILIAAVFGTGLKLLEGWQAPREARTQGR